MDKLRFVDIASLQDGTLYMLRIMYFIKRLVKAILVDMFYS